MPLHSHQKISSVNSPRTCSSQNPLSNPLGISYRIDKTDSVQYYTKQQSSVLKGLAGVGYDPTFILAATYSPGTGQRSPNFSSLYHALMSRYLKFTTLP